MYLTNVEGVCRRFCDEKRARLVWAKDEALKFHDVWKQLGPDHQRRLLSEKADVILKVRGGAGARAGAAAGHARWRLSHAHTAAQRATSACVHVTPRRAW